MAFERWFYSRGGKTQGPVPIAEAIKLAIAGNLLPTDLLWPEDVDPLMAFKANSTIDFSALPRRPPTAPPTPPPAAAKPSGVPDWLSDVQQTEQLSRQPAPPPKPALPDWLSDIEQVEQFILRSPPPPEPPPPPVSRAPVAPPVPMAIPIPFRAAPPTAAPIPMAVPVQPRPATPTAIPIPSRPPTPPAVPPGQRATPPTPARPSPTPPVAPARPSPQETGFDPDTGQILDAVKYKNWQRKQQENPIASPSSSTSSSAGLSIYEIFRKATTALQDWVDQDSTRPLIVQGTLDSIKLHPEVQRLIQSYQSHGQELMAKLWLNLAFLVENRKKFYASRA